MSSTTPDLLDGSTVRLEAFGAHPMKGLDGARTVYRVTDRP